jgi:hypothetical protein
MHATQPSGRPLLFSAALVATIMLGAADAAAQDCAEGRVSVDGYCCWPGQTFDAAAGRCSGPPMCPTGRVASGAECVPVVEPAAPAAPTAAPAATRSADVGLIAAGATLIGVGYLGAVVTSVVMGQQTASAGFGARVQAVPNWWVGFFPLVHAAAASGACCGSYDLPVIIAGIAGAAMEIGGTVLLVLGIIGHEQEPAGITAGPVRLQLGARGADAGLSVELAL